MTTPKTYWRLNYASDAVFEEMLSKCTVISVDKDFALSLQPGHGVVLARFDENAGAGIVRAIGIVTGIDRANSQPILTWKRIATSLFPSEQGKQFWRQAKPFFKFASEVAKKYQLADLFSEHFPPGSYELTNTSQKASRQEAVSGIGTGGYIYVIKSEHGYKIGKTKQMKSRAQLFSVKLPFPIEVVHYAWFDNYSSAEAELHCMFKSKRLEGEWFDLSHHDLARIKEFGSVKL